MQNNIEFFVKDLLLQKLEVEFLGSSGDGAILWFRDMLLDDIFIIPVGVFCPQKLIDTVGKIRTVK